MRSAIPFSLLLAGILLTIPVPAGAQAQIINRPNAFAISAGMGVDEVAATHIVNYVNTTAVAGQTADQFATAVDFFGAAEIPLGEEYGLKAEYTYLFKSYTFVSVYGGTNEVFYALQMPSLIGQYVITGEGYFVKFGGGFGYHFGSMEEKRSLYATTSTSKATGPGFVLEAAGQTAFDEHLFGYIGGDLRWEFLGTLKDAQGAAVSSLGQTATLNLFSAGLKFGLIYYF